MYINKFIDWHAVRKEIDFEILSKQDGMYQQLLCQFIMDTDVNLIPEECHYGDDDSFILCFGYFEDGLSRKYFFTFDVDETLKRAEYEQ